MISQTEKRIIATNIMPDISKGKVNQKIKFILSV